MDFFSNIFSSIETFLWVLFNLAILLYSIGVIITTIIRFIEDEIGAPLFNSGNDRSSAQTNSKPMLQQAKESLASYSWKTYLTVATILTGIYLINADEPLGWLVVMLPPFTMMFLAAPLFFVSGIVFVFISEAGLDPTLTLIIHIIAGITLCFAIYRYNR